MEPPICRVLTFFIHHVPVFENALFFFLDICTDFYVLLVICIHRKVFVEIDFDRMIASYLARMLVQECRDVCVFGITMLYVWAMTASFGDLAEPFVLRLGSKALIQFFQEQNTLGTRTNAAFDTTFPASIYE